MPRYRYTLKFDDDAGSLREGDGIPAEQIADLIDALVKAVHPDRSENLVIEQIVHESYGVALSMKHETTHSKLKVIHSNISQNKFSGFNSDELGYATKLRTIMGGKLHLRAFDPSEPSAAVAEVHEILLPKTPRHFFEQNTLQGTVISIGSQTEEGIPHIRVSDYPYQIEITAEQDTQLARYYRNRKLRFSVLKKMDAETGEVKKTMLEGFEVLENTPFSAAVSALRATHPEGIFNEITDTAAFVRSLRTAQEWCNQTHQRMAACNARHLRSHRFLQRPFPVFQTAFGATPHRTDPPVARIFRLVRK